MASVRVKKVAWRAEALGSEDDMPRGLGLVCVRCGVAVVDSWMLWSVRADPIRRVHFPISLTNFTVPRNEYGPSIFFNRVDDLSWYSTVSTREYRLKKPGSTSNLGQNRKPAMVIPGRLEP
jgi:hypothetical protein